MKTNVQLLVIDPQNDFCDIPEAELPLDAKMQPLARPALSVAGADADMKRLVAFIDRAGAQIDQIHVTLDSHNPIDIAHPRWWRDARGESPAPFTIITVDDVRSGKWQARDPRLQTHSLDYVERLAANKKYLLVVWPEHCLIGSWGHNVHGAVKGALDRWARAKLDVVDFVAKGTNPGTEHYSAVQAEVPDASDPSTSLNTRLIRSLSQADTVVIAGEALSHCVASTVRDIADKLRAEDVKKLVLLTDCASSVGGFEKLGEDFVAELTARGMRTTKSTDLVL